MRRHAVRQTNEYFFADAAAGTVFLSMVVLFCFYSVVWMAQDIFPDWKLSKTAVVWMHVLLIGTVALYEMGIAAVPSKLVQVLCRLGVPAVFGIVCYCYAKPRRIDLEDGACALATQFLVKFNRHLKTSYWIWSGKTELIGFAFAFWLLVILLGLLILALLLDGRVLLLLLPAAVFAAELMIGYIPQWKGMAFFFAALLFVQADGHVRKKAALHVSMGKRQRLVRAWYVRWLPVGLLAGAGMAMLLLSSQLSDATTDWLMAKSPEVQMFQKTAERNITDMWRGYFGPQTESVNNQTPNYTGKEMLQITASNLPAEDILLKGFCGTDYRNGKWVCETQAFSDACVQAGYDQKQAAEELFGAQYQLYFQYTDRVVMRYQFGDRFYGVSGGTNERTDYKVRHTGIRSRYAFVPYAVSYERGLGSSRYFLGDAQIKREGRQKEFLYNGWNHYVPGIEIGQVSEEARGVFQWYDEYVKNAYLSTSDSVPSVYEYLSAMMEDYVPSMRDYMEEIADSSYGEEQENDGEDIPVWQMRMENNWGTLLQLQQEAAQTDYSAWCNFNRLQIAMALEAALQKYQSYSMDLDPLAEGEDPVACFLMQSRKGYCVHFASAAVLFLRELGVPARYVSGYVARVRDFKPSGDSYVASVKDSSAHAWAEIYLEQVGWVPVDVTPPAAITAAEAGSGMAQGGTDASGQTDAQDGQTVTNDAQTDAEDTQTDTEDTQTDAQDEKTKKHTVTDADRMKTHWWDSLAGFFIAEDGAHRTVWQRYSLVFVAVGILLPVLACYWFFCRIVYLWHTVPEREIKAGKYRRAVRRMNCRIYRELSISRKIFGKHLSDTQYERLLKAVYQQVFVEDWARFMQIARQAAFAQDEVAAEDARFCCRIYKIVFKKAYKRVKKL